MEIILISWSTKSLDLPGYTRSQSIAVPSLTVRMSSLQGWTLASPNNYGGPFTTEQVEDVKVFLGILKVLLSVGPIFFIDVAVKITLSRHKHLGFKLHGGALVEYIMLVFYQQFLLLYSFLSISVFFIHSSHTTSQECSRE